MKRYMTKSKFLAWGILSCFTAAVVFGMAKLFVAYRELALALIAAPIILVAIAGTPLVIVWAVMEIRDKGNGEGDR